MKKNSRTKKGKKRLKAHSKTLKSVSMKKSDIAPAVENDGEIIDEKKRLALLDSDSFLSLEQAEEYWLLGEWEKLVAFDLEFLQRYHPDGGKFVLLMGGAYFQLGDLGKAREYVMMALEWGESQSNVVRILLVGVYNALAYIKMLANDPVHSELYLKKSFDYKNQNSRLNKLFLYQKKKDFKKKINKLINNNVFDSPPVSCSQQEQWIKKRVEYNGIDYSYFCSRMKYGSFVGDKMNYLYLETPKVACTSLKWLLSDLEGRNVKPTQYGFESSVHMNIHYQHQLKNLLDFKNDEIKKILISDDIIRFCIVRNPYARIASAWSNKIRQREPKYSEYWEIINSYLGRDINVCPSFKDFIFWLVDRGDDKNNVHWKPMYELLMPDIIQYHYTVRLENFSEDMRHVFDNLYPNENICNLLNKYRVNESLPYDWKSLYDDEVASLVRILFKDDFETYGYHRDSWKKKELKKNKEKGLEELKEFLIKMEESALEIIRFRNDAIFQMANKK